MFISMNTSTICVQEEDGGGGRGEREGGGGGEGRGREKQKEGRGDIWIGKGLCNRINLANNFPLCLPTHTPPPIHLVEVTEGLFIRHKHLGKLSTLFRVDPHYVAEQEDVVRCVPDLLCIQDDLLELACLCKTLDHLGANMNM